MDGGRRLAQSLTRIASLHAPPPTAPRPPRAFAAATPNEARTPRPFLRRQGRRLWFAILRFKLPRGVGATSAALLVFASIGYGMVVGDHLPAIVAAFKDARDQVGNAAGFRITAVKLTGNIHVSREEVLAIAGISGRSALIFLDVEWTRERLKTNPWIADANVLKLYPGELKIRITEREPFALWQKDSRVSVIADDGTVLEPYITPSLVRLPLVVGQDAQMRAKAFLALLDRYPDIHDQVRASILVGGRRWNLRLHNGVDVRLPENEVGRALERLVTLDRDVKLISRDITAIDLRLPDRVTVRLSQPAAQARSDELKDSAPKKQATRKAGPA